MFENFTKNKETMHTFIEFSTIVYKPAQNISDKFFLMKKNL